MIYSIHFLRGIAALFVFIYHVYHIARLYNGITLPFAEYFHIGVDIFFIISGFIMAYIVSKADVINSLFILRFIKSRFLRIFPAYFFVTIPIFFVYFYILGNPRDFTWISLLKSLLFIPFDSNGDWYPVLGVGWTLNYEVFFYGLIVISMIFLGKNYHIGVSFLIGSFLTVSLFWGDIELPFSFWFSPIILEFLIGMLIGFIYVGGVREIKFNLFFLSILLMFIYTFSSDVLHMAIATVIVVFALILERSRYVMSFFKFRFFSVLGSISYPLYLIHQPLLSLFGKVFNYFGLFASGYFFLIFFIFGFTVSYFLSYAFGRFIDDIVNVTINKYVFKTI